MEIELYIDGENKTFTAPFVPALARRQFFEIQAAAEKKMKEDKNYYPSAQEQLAEEEEVASILVDTVFRGQFTVEQLFNGADSEYIYVKLREAIYGVKQENKENDNLDG